MVPPELLEVGRVFGLIVCVWFALVGWKLLPLLRTRSRSEHTPCGVA